MNRNRVKALSGASDTGKSWICRIDLILACLEFEYAKCFISAATWTQTERAVMEPMTDFLKDNNKHYLMW